MSRKRAEMGLSSYSGLAPDPSHANMGALVWMKGAERVKRGGGLPNVPELWAR